MAKKDKKNSDSKKAAKAAKAAKQAAKSASKAKKQLKKDFAGDDEFEDDVDIDELLAQLAKEQEEFDSITINSISKPQKRINATLVACNMQQKKELVLFGGETTLNNGNVKFHNDLNIYSVDKNTWKQYICQNSPMPRSSHTMIYHQSGIMVLHGGEFSSPKQSSFHHFNDTWILDMESKEWSKVETKNGPSGRSGSRMITWKNYVLLIGGFRDLGTSTVYLNDVWAFDIMDYKWHQIEFPSLMTKPDPRSGHSLMIGQK